MEPTKQKIRTIVAAYKRTFPDEYEKLTSEIKRKRGQAEIENNEWAEIEGSDALERHMWDIPETLYAGMLKGLEDEEQDWLYARGDWRGDFSGLQWFMSEYPEFVVTKEY